MNNRVMSLSARRAWIEIPCQERNTPHQEWSLSARRAWIEIVDPDADTLTDESLSARRAWIEMIFLSSLLSSQRVALRKESVDRNWDGG